MASKKRVVVKIGTSILAKSLEMPESSTLASLVAEVCRAKSKGFEFILVTSGSIGSGMRDLGWKSRPTEIRKKQAAAAVGQVSLLGTYQNLFKSHGTLA